MAPAPQLEEAIRRLVARVRPGARLIRLERFAPDDAGAVKGDQTRKAIGFGEPIHLTIEAEGGLEELVLHAARSDELGHDRRADRLAELVLAYDTFGELPGHVRALDVGVMGRDGELRSIGEGEPYLLSSYARGRVYAERLRHVARHGIEETDERIVGGLVRYLAALHRRLEGPAAYRRAVRDLLGGGEGIFGLVDTYAADTPGAPADRLFAIEQACLRWRWRLRTRTQRLCRIHGDFHPFNIVLLADDQPRLLDASRGCRGDSADDVAALAVNFPFFALGASPEGKRGLAKLFQIFLSAYLERTGDRDLLDVIAPFLAWRTLVVASPFFYPDVEPRDRARLLDFAIAVLAADRFDPQMAKPLFA